MDPDRGVEVGIGAAHDRGGSAAGGEPGDIDAARVDRVVAHDLARDPGDQGRLAAVALLVVRVEPVPALRGVGRAGLRRPGDQAAVLLGERVHARAGGEVVRRLGAAVQHHDQRQRRAGARAGQIQLVGAGARLVGEGCRDEGRALGQRRRWPPRQRLAAAGQVAGETTQGLAQARPGQARRSGCPGRRQGREGCGRRALAPVRLRRRERGRLAHLYREGLRVDDPKAVAAARAGGGRGRRAAQQPLQQQGRLGRPAGAGEPRRLDHLGRHVVLHLRCFLWVRKRPGSLLARRADRCSGL